jgi:hypothetical protein
MPVACGAGPEQSVCAGVWVKGARGWTVSRQTTVEIPLGAGWWGEMRERGLNEPSRKALTRI